MIITHNINETQMASGHILISPTINEQVAVTCLFINNPTDSLKKAYLHIGSGNVADTQLGPINVDAKDSYILNTEKLVLDGSTGDKLSVWADSTGMNIIVSALEL